MTVKEEMKCFFDRMDPRYKFRPKTDLNFPEVYGERVRSGSDSFYWNEIEINECQLFTEVEEKFGIVIHRDVKEYFSSYYHLGIEGQYRDEVLLLTETVPREDALAEFKEALEGYYSALPDRVFVPIGISENADKVIVHNHTGEVFIENTDMVYYTDFSLDGPEFRIKIATNLEELLHHLNP